MQLVRSLISSALILTACTQATTPTSDSPPGQTGQVEIEEGLVQTVTLVPETVSSGDNLRVRSVIRNAGSASAEVESRICGLNLGGDVTLGPAPGIGSCAGYSMRRTLAPGDSVVSADIRQVKSASGAYRLRVVHALKPSAAVELDLVVR